MCHINCWGPVATSARVIHLVELKVAGLALTQRDAIQVGADGGLFVTFWTLPLTQAARWNVKNKAVRPNQTSSSHLMMHELAISIGSGENFPESSWSHSPLRGPAWSLPLVPWSPPVNKYSQAFPMEKPN